MSSERDQLYKTVQEIAVEVNTVKVAWMADRAKLQSFEQGQQIQGMQQMQVQAVQQHQHQQQVRLSRAAAWLAFTKWCLVGKTPRLQLG